MWRTYCNAIFNCQTSLRIRGGSSRLLATRTAASLPHSLNQRPTEHCGPGIMQRRCQDKVHVQYMSRGSDITDVAASRPTPQRRVDGYLYIVEDLAELYCLHGLVPGADMFAASCVGTDDLQERGCHTRTPRPLRSARRRVHAAGVL